MSRAYHIFVGRLTSRAAENRNAAVIEYSKSFPIINTDCESTSSTALEQLNSAHYGTNSSRLDPQPSSSELSTQKPSKFLQRWQTLNIKVVEDTPRKSRKLRVFKVRTCPEPLAFFDAHILQLMEQLPVEIRRAILEHVDLATLKQLRLASKAWAILGEEYLYVLRISNFHLLAFIPRGFRDLIYEYHSVL